MKISSCPGTCLVQGIRVICGFMPALRHRRIPCTILYVPGVPAARAFFGKAFGLSVRYLDESATYGELEPGATTLAFAAHSLGDSSFPGGPVHAGSSPQPLEMEIALVTPDVAAAHAAAIAHMLPPNSPRPRSLGAGGVLRPRFSRLSRGAVHACAFLTGASAFSIRTVTSEPQRFTPRHGRLPLRTAPSGGSSHGVSWLCRSPRSRAGWFTGPTSPRR